ncbi:TrbI/VirB10 family protein [Thioalkalivibrio sp. ALE19]|uniref:TrbI/VirB10 family protein n=1 Tax=Thioalkalivibrio sp. ALE19 TaxID=1266909 RepID=UPI0003FA4906|nr:TrbI/VirB10 family protein [Thioalkalivibrio sp. ALE19]
MSKKLTGIVVSAIGLLMGVGLMLSNMGGDDETGGVSEEEIGDVERSGPSDDSDDLLAELREREQAALERRRQREQELQEEADDEEDDEADIDGEPQIDPGADETVEVDPEIERERAMRERVAQSDILAIDHGGGVSGMTDDVRGAMGQQGHGAAQQPPGAAQVGMPGQAPTPQDRGAEAAERMQQAMEGMMGGAGMPPGQAQSDQPSRAQRNQQWLDDRSRQDAADRTEEEIEVRDRPHDRPVVYEGSVIPAVLQTAVNSDLPGMVTALVTRDVRDSVDGSEVVIPRGSRIIGEYNSDVLDGQDRLVFAFERIVFPDGRDIDIGNMGGADEAGASGVDGNVNTHFWSRLGRAGLIAAITIGAERQAERDQQDSFIGGEANQTGTAASEIFADTAEDSLDRHRDRGPTITIPAGETFNVMVNADIVL